MDQIRKSLHFSQAQFAMGKGPPGELPGLGWAKSWHTTQCLEDTADHRRTSVYVQLHAILTRETLGAWKPEDE